MASIKRRKSIQVMVGDVPVGGGAPIVVQSMTNTDTADINETVEQIDHLHKAGSEIVRITVNNDAAAKAVPHIKEKLMNRGVPVPIVGDFHYNGHVLLTKYPDMAESLGKFRINPGNTGTKTRDENFTTIVEQAIKYDKPVRIGVNWGSLDQQLLAQKMDANNDLPEPKSAKEVMLDTMVESAKRSSKLAEDVGLASDKIIISCKMSGVQDVVNVYTRVAEVVDYPLHVGLTEAGMGMKGMVASASALSVILQRGIGDTIRVSLTPQPGADRALEVQVAQQVLQSLGIRSFIPQVTSCPGCGRTKSTYFQELAEEIQDYIVESMPVWREVYPGVEEMDVAVMGCVVNGPGESRAANIGISLPGTFEEPKAPVYVDGEHFKTLKGDGIGKEFKSILNDYIVRNYKN
ncbi:MAG TPA: 4-hydroxy-3-methylbut-2-en-1-yl diphosphate synthase [Balneola sp.]|jgi:(E)-4-hydroxy-3-methylbut-2-enyl-diphosphate synthase|nr:4-hydroxy-3-methylbut-2-en-1-yl diphosphate synthase [Bacteroidota bacterium]MAC06790.1 4-hydroxy-3-methylbut-2-en-1-yl diphosphate synthase [Balneola sp.]MAO76986.1 4-hydroxy-3-methylbut-2-en-1-yl diphosphate synthase [Balneola sp.]MBF64553.1 4-hydroxy-3-methylbut-2-en-1-yl diphosphate synthase [Balneola sp.]MBF65805.1 4-hydroxy-3-methylbut-2-en-1-yl diphosphate synthase [Balneola sp.]|tara:strand:- start:1901 stop:3115 length:1215 start_codon:yes stop_codon:yes gene_type:complete